MGRNFLEKKLDCVISWTKGTFQRSFYLDLFENAKKTTLKCEEHFSNRNQVMKIASFYVN